MRSEIYGPVSNPFMIAVYQGNVQDADRMLGPGANVNTGFSASCNGNLDLGLPVGDAPNDAPNDAPKGQITPLVNAVSGGHLEMVEYLLKRGADPNLDAPLIGAVARGNIPIVRLLLRYGAFVDQRGDEQETALLDAIDAPRGLDVAHELIAAGADVHATNSSGDNAVMLSAWRHKLEMFRFFVNLGIDACATDQDHDTALSLADSVNDYPGKAEIISYLKARCSQ